MILVQERSYFRFPLIKHIKRQMGTCASGERDSRGEKIQPFDTVPSDAQSLSQVSLPTLAFYVLISDIKVKKCTYESLYLKFKIDGVHEYAAPLRDIDRGGKAYWKIAHVFQFYMTQYQLRNKFLLIEAYDNHRTLLGSLKINMFVLWVGPYHLDFKFELPKAKNCRISLNFKISQGIHLSIDNISTELIPQQPKFLEDRFTYTIEAVIGQQLEASTCPYLVRIKENTNIVKEDKSVLQTYHVTKDKIVWKDEMAKELLLPKFDKKIAFYEIYSSSLHLIFFHVLPGLEQKSQLRYQIDSQCYISLAKLMTLDYVVRKDAVTNITYYERKVELTEKTWLHGKEMGKVKISFGFTLQSHLKQMQACVRTEKGILTSSPVFNQNTSQARTCQQIESLKLINNDVQKQFINLDQNTELKNNFIMIKENILRIVNLLTKELALLQKSSKQSILFYEYKNETQLHKAQRFMIDLAFKATSYIHEDNPDICEVCWNILTVILKRGEFKLSHLGFSKSEKEKIENKTIDDNLRDKIQVALKYQQLLNHLLKQTLTLLEYKGEQAEQVFAQSFCSYAYFRIPLFREHILSVIHRENDPVIREWRGTEVNLYQDSESTATKNDDFYQNLFDWENNFYKPIMTEDKYKLNNIQLQSILLEDKWKNRLAKRSGAFYTFLQNLVKEIEYVSVVSKYIKWHHMPGYNRLLHAFLVEMKSTKIKNYTDRFKKCCTKLVANQKLLNIFVMILLSNTNVNDPDTVQITFQMIDGFLHSIKKNLRYIPGTFDYKYFMEGMKIVLNSELSFSISQVLLLIYNHLSTFSQQFRLQLCLYLLSKPFFRYFFNWSYNLRHIFQTLLYVKISKIASAEDKYSASLSPQKQSQQWSYVTNMRASIHQKYSSLMQIIEKEIEPKLKNMNDDRFYQKMLFKKMKAKLQSKKTAKGNSLRHGSIHLQSLKQIQLPDIRTVKSLSTTGPMINPYKLIYFKEDQMGNSHPTERQLAYGKEALAEYHAIIDQINKHRQFDPDFLPEMKVKKVMDEKELGPLIVDQW